MKRWEECHHENHFKKLTCGTDIVPRKGRLPSATVEPEPRYSNL
ncbi:hypothetical protein [Vibrio penaeicida]|nr:hypothetical protein [Vibrio penaeicida]